MTISDDLRNTFWDAYYVAVLTLSTGAFVTAFVNVKDGSTAADGSPLFKVLWGLIYLVSVIRLIPYRDALPLFLKHNKALALLVLLALISALWSIDSVASLHLAATLALTTLISLDISSHYSMERQMDLICIALVITTLLSVVVELFLPGVIPGRDAEDAAWHGVFGFKNDFGRMICLTLIACLSRSKSSWKAGVTTVAVGIVLAIMSHSASAVGYVCILTVFFYGWSIVKWPTTEKRSAILLVMVIVCMFGYWSSQNFVQLTAAIDKDPHMTGRVDLWQLSIDDIEVKPLLGYGYKAFWGYDSQPARRIREAVNWDEAPHAHNGYIDLALSLGIVGLVTYFVAVCSTLQRAYTYWLGGYEPSRKWPLTLLAFVSIYQCTESGIVGGNSIVWILFCCLAFSLSLRPYVKGRADIRFLVQAA